MCDVHVAADDDDRSLLRYSAQTNPIIYVKHKQQEEERTRAQHVRVVPLQYVHLFFSNMFSRFVLFITSSPISIVNVYVT